MDASIMRSPRPRPKASTRLAPAVTRRAFVGGLGYFFLCSAATAAFQLVTEEESALPDDPLGTVRGVTRGPDIVFISPAPNAGLVKSPLNLRIRFKAHGGSRVDRDSILITYKKLPAVDMTQRLTPFIRADGIDIPAAEIPAGTHRFRFDVKDSAGREATGYLVINVRK